LLLWQGDGGDLAEERHLRDDRGRDDDAVGGRHDLVRVAAVEAERDALVGADGREGGAPAAAGADRDGWLHGDVDAALGERSDNLLALPGEICGLRHVAEDAVAADAE